MRVCVWTETLGIWKDIPCRPARLSWEHSTTQTKGWCCTGGGAMCVCVCVCPHVQNVCRDQFNKSMHRPYTHFAHVDTHTHTHTHIIQSEQSLVNHIVHFNLFAETHTHTHTHTHCVFWNTT